MRCTPALRNSRDQRCSNKVGSASTQERVCAASPIDLAVSGTQQATCMGRRSTPLQTQTYSPAGVWADDAVRGEQRGRVGVAQLADQQLDALALQQAAERAKRLRRRRIQAPHNPARACNEYQATWL